MLRHGMLSPNSKLLPQLEVDPTRLSIMSGLSSSSYLSNASNLSLMSMTSTCSKHPKDARDTAQRRVRHRDGKLLKGGIGLTTGLGWSDRSVSYSFLSWAGFARDLKDVILAETRLFGCGAIDGWNRGKRRAGRRLYVAVDRISADYGAVASAVRRSPLGGMTLRRAEPVFFRVSLYFVTDGILFCSEDEDAPSLLTRRVSTLVLTRRASSSSVASNPLSRSASHTVLREADEYETRDDPDEFGCSRRSSIATRSLPSRSKPVSRVGSVRSIGSSLGRYSTYSTSSVPRARTGSVSESSMYAASIASKPDNDGNTGLMPGIREQDDGITPTRAAFERSSLGSLNGASGPDIPHTPSSTASSGSLPFPPTPESGEEIPQLQPLFNQDKVLPPLPPTGKGKYSSSTGLRSQSGGLQRPRTYSNTSSVSNSSLLGVPASAVKSRSTSPTSTPRQSLGERHAKTAPAASPRPSLNGTPRPSLTIPKTPLPHQSPASGLPRPTTPSLSTSSNASQGYTPRPLRLMSRSSPLPSSTSPTDVSPRPLSNQAELNQSPTKVIQPGERSPRPGQVLTYNRNLHDQLKLRTLSLNTGSQAPAVSPGGTQTLLMPSQGARSAPSSAVPTPVTAQSQSPLPNPSPVAEGFRPRPRTGTGMMYRTNLSVVTVPTSRIRVPSTVPQ